MSVTTHPRLLAAAFGLTLVAVVFHELGHAAACHHGGGRPGRIGAAVFMMVPAFFTNVTDSYRLSRTARIRTDLGGIYFNCLFVTVAGLVALRWPSDLLVVVVFLVDFNLLQQLLPLGRLDGYFVLSDIAGVPDLFGAVQPRRHRLVHRRRARQSPDPAPLTRPALRRRAGLLVAIWGAVVFPALLAIFALFLLQLPEFARATWRVIRVDALAAGGDVSHHRVVDLALIVVSLFLLVVPYVGLALLSVRGVRLATTKVTARRRRRLGGANAPVAVGG